jgi:hypothetical protein
MGRPTSEVSLNIAIALPKEAHSDPNFCTVFLVILQLA